MILYYQFIGDKLFMFKVQKNISSIVFSCTKSVLLVVAIICLLYFSSSIIANSSNSITLKFSDTVILFLTNNSGKLFIGWLTLLIWTCCVYFKIGSNNIKVPTILKFLLFLLIPIGSFILFLVSISLISPDIQVIARIWSILLLLSSVMMLSAISSNYLIHK